MDLPIAYPKLVSLAWDVDSRVVHDWQQSPFMFVMERDIQAQLYRRLAEICEGTEQEWIDGRRATFPGTRDRWYRVACEPSVTIDAGRTWWSGTRTGR